MKKIILMLTVFISFNSFSSEKLLSAIANKESAIAKKLIKSGDSVNFQNKVGETALIMAANAEDLGMVKLLVEKGANINLRDKAGHSALFYAISMNNSQIASYLFEKKAEIILEDLFQAVQLGSASSVKKILKLNPDFTQKTNKDGETALFEAVRFSQSKIADILIKAGTDRTHKNKQGKVAIDLITTQTKSDLKMIKILSAEK